MTMNELRQWKEIIWKEYLSSNPEKTELGEILAWNQYKARMQRTMDRFISESHWSNEK